MENFRYISENTIQHLSLHDCVCTKLFYENASLIFEMDWMEVLSTHPDNPFGQAHQSGSGRIVLSDSIADNIKLAHWSSNGIKTITLTELTGINDFEILDFNEEKTKDGFILSLYGVFGRDSQFDSIEMSIRYSSSKVMFNDLGAVSWFESFEP